MQHKVTAQIGSTQISIETGKIAKLADVNYQSSDYFSLP